MRFSDFAKKIAFEVLIFPSVGLELKRQYDRYQEKKKREKAVACLVKDAPCNELIVMHSVECTPEKCLKINSPQMESFASELFATVLKQGLLKQDFSGMLQCNVDVSKLARSEDGFLRGFVLGPDGKISEQAKFREIPSIQISPAMAFQVMSFVTGQYYQHIITKQLNSISLKLDQIIDMMESEDKAKIKQYFEELRIIYNTQYYAQEDFNSAREINKEAGVIQKKYRDLVLKAKIEKAGHSLLLNLREAKAWNDNFVKSRFLQHIQIAMMAEYLYYCTSSLLIKIEFSKPNPDLKKIGAISSSMDINFSSIYAKKYHEVKTLVCKNIEMLSQPAETKNHYFESLPNPLEMKNFFEMKSLLDSLNKEFNAVEVFTQKIQENLSPTYFIRYNNGQPVNE